MSESKKYIAEEIETKWSNLWESQGTYRYNPEIDRSKTYTIDTPPPTVSGSLHVGHVFSYTQTDVIARFKRMMGLNIYYPMGWDDNGLPTERRIQKLFNIICDPTLPYQEDVPEKTEKRTAVSRKNFIQLCQKQTKIDEQKYEALWRSLGLSIDWSQQYATIDKKSQRTSQLSFLDLLRKGYAYNKYELTSWDTDFQTAIAQAEMEDRERESFFYQIKFLIKETGESFTIATTRPEMLPACIAIVANPDDERFKKYFGLTAVSPLFSSEIPFLPSGHAIPDKGTGCLMICTFGDTDDFQFWKTSETKLPLRQILSKQGKFLEIKFDNGIGNFQSAHPETANKNYLKIQGLNVQNARKEILSLLSEDGSLMGDPLKINQTVKFYEKGDKPIELIPVRQWFIKVMDYKKEFLEQGRKIKWHPEPMQLRYEQWVEALNQDWSISRQRYFGVPFPIWYKLDEAGHPDYSNPIIPNENMLPIDPLANCPEGFAEAQRNQPNGFMGDPDVMDTWATSSVTPLINSSWKQDDKRHRHLFPADLRPQAHEIIRTWAFYTIVKSWMHENEIPWKEIAISGWVVDPNKNKMSKSKGNIIEPEKIIQSYSADAVRYWAAKARLGNDTLYDENLFKIGKKLETKILNAFRFVNTFSPETSIANLGHPSSLENIDSGWLGSFCETVKEATTQLENLNYAAALEMIEKLFWDFCDDYIEIVKARAYQGLDNSSAFSAIYTLKFSMNLFLRLFAPYLPFITEELWSQGEKLSIHNSRWPNGSEFFGFSDEHKKLWILCQSMVREIRQQKSSKNMGVGYSLKKLNISSDSETAVLIRIFQADLINVSRVSPDGFSIETIPFEKSETKKYHLSVEG